MKRIAAFAAALLVCLAVGIRAQTPPPVPHPLANANQIHFDNTASGLNASNVQSGMLELEGMITNAGIAIDNRATGGFTFDLCDDENPTSTSAMQLLAGAKGAYVTVQLTVDQGDIMYWKVGAPWAAFDILNATSTLYPSAASPAIQSVLTSGLFTGVFLTTDAATINVEQQGSQWMRGIYVGPNRALQMWGNQSCLTFRASVIVAEPAQ